MNNINDIPVSLRVPSQVPLDTKLYRKQSSELLDLGLNDNRAFTYYRGMRVYCSLERKTFEWRENLLNEIGILPTDFIYPIGTNVMGIDYSNKAYNFIEVPNIQPVNADWNSTSGLSEILNKPTEFPPLVHTHTKVVI